MRKSTLVVFVLFLLVSTFAVCQDKVSVFGGWQYMSVDTQGVTDRQSAVAGWDADVAFKVLPKVALVGDFSGSYKTVDSVKFHLHNFVFGPRVSTSVGKLSPFAEALFGMNRTSVTATTTASNNGFAMAIGGGVDYNASRAIGIRLVKFDYLRDSVDSVSLNNIRIATGVVFRF